MTEYKITKYLFSNSNYLVNSHSNLSQNAGDTIWLSNIVNILISLNNKVTIVTHTLNNNCFISNIENTKMIDVKYVDQNKIYEYLNNTTYDHYIIRNHLILDKIKKEILIKSIVYCLDVHIKFLKKINDVDKLWTQSNILKEKIIKSAKHLEKKIIIVEPYAYQYKFKTVKKKPDELTLIYCGTLREEENINEIIKKFEQVDKKKVKVNLLIVFGKFRCSPIYKKQFLNLKNKNIQNLTIYQGLSHKKCMKLIAESDVGICWRKKGYGENGEISTKIQEYQLYGLKIINDGNQINTKHLFDLFNQKNKN